MRRRICVALLMLLAGMAPVRGQDVRETLKLIPSESFGFAIVNRLDQFNGKLKDLGKRLHVPVPLAPLELLDKELGIKVTKGVNLKGCGAVVLLPPADDGDPIVLVILPVSNYAQFVGQFKGKEAAGIAEINIRGTTFAVAGKGKHALLVKREYSEHLKRTLATKENMLTWAAPIRDWIEDNDVSVVVTPRSIKKGTDPILAALPMIRDAINAAPEAALFKDWVDGFESFVKAVETDVTHAGIGGRIDQLGNITVDARGLFARKSSLAKGAAKLKGQVGGPLAGLPRGPFALVFGGALPANSMEALMKLQVPAIVLEAKKAGVNLPAEKVRMLEDAYARMGKGMHGMTLLARPDGSIFGGIIATVSTDDPAGYMEAYEKSLPLINAVYKEINTPAFPTAKLVKKKIGTRTVLEVTVDMSKAVPGDDPQSKAVIEAMFGKARKMVFSQTVLDDRTILTAFTDAEGLVRVIQTLNRGSLKNDPDLARTLRVLPQGAQWVLLVSPRDIMKMVRETATAIDAASGAAIPEFPRTPPVGAAARLSETGLILQIAVPVEVLDGIGRLVGAGR